MRIILIYDLSMKTDEDQKSYNRFHKWIIRRGYIMMQYSIYIKSINAPTKLIYEKVAIEKIIPKNGNIRLITITENQYHNIEILRGYKTTNESLNSTERYVKIDENI